MKRELPETPVFDSLVEKYGSLSVFDMYFDDNMDPLPDAPKELIDETKKYGSSAQNILLNTDMFKIDPASAGFSFTQ